MNRILLTVHFTRWESYLRSLDESHGQLTIDLKYCVPINITEGRNIPLKFVITCSECQVALKRLEIF